MQLHLGELLAAGKGTVANGSHRCRNINGAECRTVLERRRLYGGELFAQADALQELATAEGFFADGYSFLGEVENVQCPAVAESSCPNGGDALGQRYLGEGGAPVEGFIGNGGDAFEHAQFGEAGDVGLALEHGAKVGNGGSLAKADAPVVVGIPVLDAQLAHGSILECHGFVFIIFGFHANDGFLPAVVAIVASANALRTGCEVVEQIETIAAATPSPVDVVAPFAVVAVAHKGVAGF